MKNPKAPHPAIEPLAQALGKALAAPLPGYAAQERLEPRPLHGSPPRRDRREGRPAAGLLLLYPRDGEIAMLLTVRSHALPTHRGQVSLPGGLQETDEALADTATREAEEEVGVEGDRIRVVGSLSPIFIPPSGFLLHPFVAIHPTPPVFRINSTEVARVLEVPLDELRDPQILRSEKRELSGAEFTVPYFSVEDQKVWGATAMVLAEFLCVMDSMSPPGQGQATTRAT